MCDTNPLPDLDSLFLTNFTITRGGRSARTALSNSTEMTKAETLCCDVSYAYSNTTCELKDIIQNHSALLNNSTVSYKVFLNPAIRLLNPRRIGIIMLKVLQQCSRTYKVVFQKCCEKGTWHHIDVAYDGELGRLMTTLVIVLERMMEIYVIPTDLTENIIEKIIRK